MKENFTSSRMRHDSLPKSILKGLCWPALMLLITYEGHAQSTRY